MRYGAYTAGLSALLSAGIGVAAIYLGHPVLGMGGWCLADAALFAVVAWRVHCLSLPWAVAGLALFALERIAGLAIHPSFGAIVGQVTGAILFGRMYRVAVRGGLYLGENSPAGGEKRQAAPTQVAPTQAASIQSTPTEADSNAAPRGGTPAAAPKFSQDDYAEFLKYLQQKDRRFQRPGKSVQDEFAVWKADRARKQAAKRPAQEVGAKS